MTTKAYLSQIKRIENRVERLKDQLQTIRAEMSMLKSPTLEKDHIQSSSSEDKMLKLIIKYGDTERRLLAVMDRLLNTRDRIYGEIESMENEKYKRILYLRYVNGILWEQIAEEMHADLRWTYRLHGYALEAFSKVRH